MLRVIRRGWFLPTFKVFENDVELHDIEFKFGSKTMNFEIQGVDYKFEARETFFSGGSYSIESNNSILAVADRPGMLGRTFSFDLGTRQYQMCPKSNWKRSFVLLEGERQVGEIYCEKGFSGEFIAELPADLSLPIKIFLLWLILLMWHRDSIAFTASI